MLVYIQILRFAAALAVAAFHAWGIAPRFITVPADTPTLGLWQAGHGVDLFFVISGFVMVYASRDLFGAPDGARMFLARRVARIVPLYWATTSLFAITLLLLPSALSSAPPSVAEIVKSYLFIPYASAGSDMIQPIYKLGWTLNYEMFFYAIFAVALFLQRGLATFVVIGTLSLLAAIGVWFAPQPGAFAFWTNSIILEFALGAIIATLYVEGVRLKASTGIGFAIVGLLALAIGHVSGANFYGPWRPFLWGAPATLIVAGAALRREQLRSGFAVRLVLMLGEASYAIYLLHPIVIRALRMLWDRSGASASLNPWLFIAVALPTIALIAIAIHYRVETPMTRLLRKWLGAREPRRANAAGGLQTV